MHDEGKLYGKKELQHNKVYAFWKEIDFTNSSTVGFNNGKIIRPEEVQLFIERMPLKKSMWFRPLGRYLVVSEQDGILSPALFSLYLNDLSVKLNACKTGCIVGNVIVINVC